MPLEPQIQIKIIGTPCIIIHKPVESTIADSCSSSSIFRSIIGMEYSIIIMAPFWRIRAEVIRIPFGAKQINSKLAFQA